MSPVTSFLIHLTTVVLVYTKVIYSDVSVVMNNHEHLPLLTCADIFIDKIRKKKNLILIVEFSYSTFHPNF